jgi:predicted AlkP superfamily pyrophosphatase or phosphodiesterase
MLRARLATLGFLTSCAHPPTSVLPTRHEATVILVGIDGFRPDYLDRPGAVRLRALARSGVRAERLIPAFPTKSFPNLFTIATGLYPGHHGIVGNTIVDPAIGRFSVADTIGNRDPRWWKGEPIWITAERQGHRAATMFWVGSEVPFDGRRATYWHSFDAGISPEARVDQVLAWLRGSDPPELVTLYLNRVDLVGHRHGPDGPAMDSAIAQVDSSVGRLVAGLRTLGNRRIDLLVVSDHGMTAIDSTRLIVLDDWVALDPDEIVDLAPVTTLHPHPGREDSVYRRLRGVPHLGTYRRTETPAGWHFRDPARVSPLVLVADDGWSVVTRAWWATHPHSDRGNHGYDPAMPSMAAIFLATGPDFPAGRVVPPFENVHLYSLIAHLLRLTPRPTDGSLDSIAMVLR